MNYHAFGCYKKDDSSGQEDKLKYSQIVPRKVRREKDKQIRDQWKREAGPQFGMILEVLPSSFFRKRRREKVA